MHILGCLSVFLLFAVILVFSLVRGFFRMLFGWGTKGNADTRSYTSSSSESEKQKARTSSASYPASKGKVIGDDEGEYVDFEEVDEGK